MLQIVLWPRVPRDTHTREAPGPRTPHMHGWPREYRGPRIHGGQRGPGAPVCTGSHGISVPSAYGPRVPVRLGPSTQYHPLSLVGCQEPYNTP